MNLLDCLKEQADLYDKNAASLDKMASSTTIEVANYRRLKTKAGVYRAVAQDLRHIIADYESGKPICPKIT